MLQIAMYVKCLVRSASSEISCPVPDRLYICLFDLHLARHDQKSEPILLRRRRRRVGLSKYGVIKSGWSKRKDQLPDISRIFASSESRQLPHVHLQNLVRCRELILREALRDRFSSCYRVREDTWNDDLSRCCSWLVAFAASLAWLNVFHAAIGERGSGVTRVPADVVVVL